MKVTLVSVVLFVACNNVFSLTQKEQIGPEYTSSVNETSFKVLKALIEESKNIALGKTRLDQAVEISQESIQEEIDEFREFIQDTIEDAEDDGFDIESCVNQTEPIVNIDVAAIFSRCKIAPQLRYLDAQKEIIGKISASFPEEVNICLFKKAVFGHSLDDCLESKIQQIESRLQQISKSVEGLLSAAFSYSARCTKSTLIKLDSYVMNAARDFEKCTDDILDLSY